MIDVCVKVCSVCKWERKSEIIRDQNWCDLKSFKPAMCHCEEVLHSNNLSAGCKGASATDQLLTKTKIQIHLYYLVFKPSAVKSEQCKHLNSLSVSLSVMLDVVINFCLLFFWRSMVMKSAQQQAPWLRLRSSLVTGARGLCPITALHAFAVTRWNCFTKHPYFYGIIALLLKLFILTNITSVSFGMTRQMSS